jgi:hypothetical protein
MALNEDNKKSDPNASKHSLHPNGLHVLSAQTGIIQSISIDSRSGGGLQGHSWSSNVIPKIVNLAKIIEAYVSISADTEKGMKGFSTLINPMDWP